MAMMLIVVNESSCSIGSVAGRPRIVEILSHFENFLTKAQKVAYRPLLFSWAHIQFYK